MADQDSPGAGLGGCSGCLLVIAVITVIAGVVRAIGGLAYWVAGSPIEALFAISLFISFLYVILQAIIYIDPTGGVRNKYIGLKRLLRIKTKYKRWSLDDKWYNTRWVLVLLILLFYPIGVIGAYKNETLGKRLRWGGVLAVGVILIGYFAIGNDFSDTSGDSKSYAKKENSEAKQEDVKLSREFSDVGSISVGPKIVDRYNINGMYEFNIGGGRSIYAVFVTWDKLSKVDSSRTKKYKKEYSEYDGIFYIHDNSRNGKMIGAWRLSTKIHTGLNKAFVPISTVTFKTSNEFSQSDFVLLYDRVSGRSVDGGLAIRSSPNRFFEAEDKTDIPRYKSFYYK